MDSSDTRNHFVGDAGAPSPAVLAVNDTAETAKKRAVTREVGTLLIVSGIAGILLPGPVGTPLLILGCVMIWPRGFERIELLFEKRFPRTHRFGVLQSQRFLNDLERRYPVSR